MFVEEKLSDLFDKGIEINRGWGREPKWNREIGQTSKQIRIQPIMLKMEDGF
jgi:hypothetical protein